MFKNKGISKNQNYKPEFHDWEIAVATKKIQYFRLVLSCFKECEFEDLLQICLAHWSTKRDTYDKSKGANPRTYMAEVVQNKLKDEAGKLNSQKRIMSVIAESLNTPVNDEHDSKERIDLVKNDGLVHRDYQNHEAVELRSAVSRVLANLNPKQNNICNLLTEGYTKVEIAELLSTKRTTLNDEINRIKKIFAREGLKEFLK